MYTTQQQNLILYQKSKRKVTIHLIVYYILLLLFTFGVYFAFQNIKFIECDDANFNQMMTLMMIAKACYYALVFFLLSLGNKWLKYIFYLMIVLNLGLLYFPIVMLINNLDLILPIFVYIGAMLIEVVILLQMASYFQNNRWCKVYYEHVIEVDEDDEEDWVEEETEGEEFTSNTQKLSKKFEESDDFVEEKAEPTYPQYALRLGIVVYASLMIFPIFVQIFANSFESLDMQQVFATKDMFMFCIFSAFIWTIPIFYLYYDHYYSKRLILGCMLLELLRIGIYLPKFIGYIQSEEYSMFVFILFTIIDFVRIIVLIITALPILKSHQKFKNTTLKR